ncbi:Dilute domain [Trinorchestia longiramus]|nr:Dilute domain [Trinorchestia longiramus]
MDMLPFGFYSVREVVRATDEDFKLETYSPRDRPLVSARTRLSSVSEGSTHESSSIDGQSSAPVSSTLPFSPTSDENSLSVPSDEIPPPPPATNASSFVFSKSPIFIISVLPQTSLPAHAFQQQLSPLSPHHYPAAPPLWPILTPPLGQFARNLYLKKYTRANYKYFNTYLPVNYKHGLSNVKWLKQKSQIHPCIHKLWRDLNDEDNVRRIRAQSLDSSDGADKDAEVLAESLAGSFYVASTPYDEDADRNSLSSNSSSETVVYTKEMYGGRDPSQLYSSLAEGVHKDSHARKLLRADAGQEFLADSYRLAYELRVSTSTFDSLSAELYYGSIVYYGYFDECLCEESHPRAASELPDVAAPVKQENTVELSDKTKTDDEFDVDSNDHSNCPEHNLDDEDSCKVPPLVEKSNHFTLKGQKYVPAEPIPFEINLEQLTVSKLSSLSSSSPLDTVDIFSVSSPNVSREAHIGSTQPLMDRVESSMETLEGVVEVAETATNAYLPAIRKKERDYMGMMEYDKRDETTIIKMLIYDLKPRIAVSLLPGLPAYILFMCIRHTDHINDDEKVRSLLNHTMTGIKRVIKKRHQDLDSTVLWLSNTLRLLHNLKQYSGDKAFQQDNTSKQNEQSLKNFDLSEYRQVLSDMAVWIYNGVIKLMEESIQPLVVPSILELEAISGLSGSKPGPMRGRKSSSSEESPEEPQKALDLLLNELTVFYRTLAAFGTDPELISQVFRQVRSFST